MPSLDIDPVADWLRWRRAELSYIRYQVKRIQNSWKEKKENSRPARTRKDFLRVKRFRLVIIFQQPRAAGVTEAIVHTARINNLLSVLFTFSIICSCIYQLPRLLPLSSSSSSYCLSWDNGRITRISCRSAHLRGFGFMWTFLFKQTIIVPSRELGHRIIKVINKIESMINLLWSNKPGILNDSIKNDKSYFTDQINPIASSDQICNGIWKGKLRAIVCKLFENDDDNKRVEQRIRLKTSNATFNSLV